MAEQRLPRVNGDDGIWGDILNQFISKEHYNIDSDNAANGGHKWVTIQASDYSTPGTASAAPIKLTTGPLLGTRVAGAIEFLSDRLYFTQTTGTTRKTIAAYDDASGASGDMYYRDSGGNFVRFSIGSENDVLTVNGSNQPTWTAPATPGLSQQQVMAINSMRI